MERYKQLLLIFSVCVLFLVGTLGYISVFRGPKYANMAAAQRTLSDGSSAKRGLITDRNFIPLTGRGVSGKNRYGEKRYAGHLIGYTDVYGNGVSGIEKAFDSELSQSNPRAEILVDARGDAIPNFKMIFSGTEDDGNVRLTLDYHIQKICENVLDKSQISGAVVVLDVQSFDVLAMVSRPDFNVDEVSQYIKDEGTQLLNRAVSPYNCGSIFKIITTAAFLEEKDGDNFLSACGGSMKINDISFGCHKATGHGIVTLEQAFSKSCNCAFYDMGVELGGSIICQYARAFGMGSGATGGILSESSGKVPEYFAGSEAESANLSIGQGELMITPLQAARMACVIAAGGVVKAVNIADCIFDQDCRQVKRLRRNWTKRIISAETAERIGYMMKQATLYGTGTNANSELVAIAGKTGSAETGWMTENGYMVQGWYVGYFPYEAPRYAMAVISENGRQGNISSAPVFKEIAEGISRLKGGQKD